MSRLIDADALEELFRELIGRISKEPEMTKDFEHIVRASAMTIEMINDAPTIDVVEVVRCKDCIRRDPEDKKVKRLIYVYTIPGNPITKKNSMRMVKNHKTGKMFPMPSKPYLAYEETASYFLQPRPPKPIECQAEVTCLYFMGTRRKCDLTNLLEATDDILVKCGILADDNYTIVFSHDGSRVGYSKENPRTEIRIETYESRE